MRYARAGAHLQSWSSCGAVLLLFLCAADPAHAGWQLFLPSDGIIGQEAWDVEVGPDGNVWFLTDNGVSRYDGLTWTNYPQSPDLWGMSFSSRCLLIDRAGNVWVAGTPVPSYSPGERPYLVKFDGLRWEPVWTDLVKETNQMIEDSDGNIWFATNYGIARFDGTDWTSFRRGSGATLDIHNGLLQDSQGAIWFATEKGIRSFRDGIWTDITSANGVDLGSVRAIDEDRQGALWLGTKPIMRFDGVNWTTYGTADAPPWAATYPSGWAGWPAGFAEDQEGNLWIPVVGSGVVRFRDGVWKIYRDSDDPRMTGLEDVAVDGYDNVWVATRLGLLRFDGEDWDYLHPGSETSTNQVTAMLEERPGVSWIGTSHGLYRYDNGVYTIYTPENAPLGSNVTALEWGPDGSLWVGSFGNGAAGLSFYDGHAWMTRATSSIVAAIHKSRSGEMYVGMRGGPQGGGGLIRVVGSEWTLYNMENGLLSDQIYSIAENDSGYIWVAAKGYGVGRFDGQEWDWYTPGNGLSSNSPNRIACAPGGDVWVATNGGGIDRFQNGGWTNYGTADGLSSLYISSIHVDRGGVVWAGSSDAGNVARFDGLFWKSFTTLDGLPGGNVLSFMEDNEGRIWFGSEWGIGILEQDRVAPNTFFHPLPAPASPSRRQTLSLRAAYTEAKGILYSHSLDGVPWSAWTDDNTWSLPELSDGLHDLWAKSRDSWGNEDLQPAHATIEIDATAPAPVITSPVSGQPVRGSTEIHGTAADARFFGYRVEIRPAASTSWNSGDATLIVESVTPVRGGTMAEWNTTTVPDGDYELRVLVSDSLGLSGSAEVKLVVDNHAPFADVTTPARVTATAGGDIYTTNSELHLYFPPRAFPADAIVTIAPTAADSVPTALPSGATRLLPGYEISWGGAALAKQATLEFSLAGVDLASSPGSAPGLYRFGDNAAEWQRLGGTVDKAAGRISLAITEPGRYTLFADAAASIGEGDLSRLSFTPRVFSPTGGFAAREVGISFTLGRAAPVTVRVYSRSGRLVRDLLVDSPLGSGSNLVRWDGRDGDGGTVADGIYLVTVEALGNTETKPLAVVR